MATPRNLTESRVIYNEGERTYAEKQLAAFFNPARNTRKEVSAEWAPKFDPLNGKIAGDKEKLGPFGKPRD